MKFKHSTKHVVANCRQTGTGQSVLCCYVASRPTNLFPNYFSHCFAQRTGPAVQISSQKTIGLQIRPMWTQWTIRYGVQCWRLTASLKQSWKQAPNSRKRFRLSGATCHRDRSTRLLKIFQIRRLEAGVVAWRWRWTLWTFTVTMEFWLINI